MSGNSLCNIQTCIQNCCDASGDCPSGGSTCFYYYNNATTTTTNIGLPVGLAIGGVILFIVIVCGIRKYIQKKRLR
jgi:hypothetical protein